MCPFKVLPGRFGRIWRIGCRPQGWDKWSVKFDVRDLGGHLDTTFRGWSSTLAARVRLVVSRLALIFVLPLDLHGRDACCQVYVLACCFAWD